MTSAYWYFSAETLQTTTLYLDLVPNFKDMHVTGWEEFRREQILLSRTKGFVKDDYDALEGHVLITYAKVHVC